MALAFRNSVSLPAGCCTTFVAEINMITISFEDSRQPHECYGALCVLFYQPNFGPFTNYSIAEETRIVMKPSEGESKNM